MRVLIAGSDKVFAIENFYAKHMAERGVDVLHFPSQSIFYDYYGAGLFNKLKFRAGVSGIYKKINDQLKSLTEQHQADVIWIFKGMEIFPSTLQWAKERKIKVVNFNGDNPFVFSGRGSGNQNVTDSIGLYDLHFTYHTGVKSTLENEYHAKAVWLPFGFDIRDDLFRVSEQQEEILKTCFLGNPDRQRVAFLLALAEHGAKIDVYGHDWEKYVAHQNITVKAPVYGDEQWKTLRRYRIQLNLMRIHNEHSHNMRTFEVPAIGGIMLAPDTPEHRLFFENGKEIFLFKDGKDCGQLINELLQLSHAQANEVRKAARARSIQSGYSYKSRAHQVIMELERLIHG
jgi:spore maturation protein CgeB